MKRMLAWGKWEWQWVRHFVTRTQICIFFSWKKLDYFNVWSLWIDGGLEQGATNCTSSSKVLDACWVIPAAVNVSVLSVSATNLSTTCIYSVPKFIAATLWACKYPPHGSISFSLCKAWADYVPTQSLCITQVQWPNYASMIHTLWWRTPRAWKDYDSLFAVALHRVRANVWPVTFWSW